MVSARTVRRICAASLIVPTVDHLVSPTLRMLFAPAVMSTMFGLGAFAAVVFFILLGLFQLASIGIIVKSNNRGLFVLGILGNLVSILIYFISTSGVTIFGVPSQPLIPFGILIKALEAVFVAASAYLLSTGLR